MHLFLNRLANKQRLMFSFPFISTICETNTEKAPRMFNGFGHLTTKNLSINWRKDKKKDCPCFLGKKLGYTEMKSKTVRIRSQKSGSKQSQNYGVSKLRTEDTKPLGSGQIPTLKHSTREPRLKRCFEFLVHLMCKFTAFESERENKS